MVNVGATGWTTLTVWQTWTDGMRLPRRSGSRGDSPGGLLQHSAGYQRLTGQHLIRLLLLYVVILQCVTQCSYTSRCGCRTDWGVLHSVSWQVVPMIKSWWSLVKSSQDRIVAILSKRNYVGPDIGRPVLVPSPLLLKLSHIQLIPTLRFESLGEFHSVELCSPMQLYRLFLIHSWRN